MEEVLTRGTAASARSSLGFRLPASWQNRYDKRLQGTRGSWLHQYSHLRCVGRFDQPTTIISRGYGAALALPVWTQVMNKAAQHYPAEQLHRLCRSSTPRSVRFRINSPLRAACRPAQRTTLICPPTRLPTAACQVHGGEQFPFAQQFQGLPQKAATFPGRFFKSFRKLFGGR